MQNPKLSDVQRALEEEGYSLVRRKGDHQIWKNKAGHTISIVAASKEHNGALAKAILKKIKTGGADRWNS